MNAIVISGSRNPQGQTARAADAVVEGMAEQGWHTEFLFLPTMNIERCRQCEDSGWGVCRPEGRCIIKEDDFAGIVDKIRAADAVVFATPVYFSDLAESLRAFLDRLRRISVKTDHREGVAGKPMVGVCVAGGGGGGAPACCRRLEDIARTCGFEPADFVPVRRQNLRQKLNVLRETGKWLARSVSAGESSS